MGFLDDLVKTIQEAAEEAKRQQRKPQSPEWTAPEPQRPAETQSARIVRRRREEPAAAPEQAEARAPHRHQPRTPHAPHAPAAETERLRRLMRQPETLRELMVLKELLDRPLALRHGKWARRCFGAR